MNFVNLFKIAVKALGNNKTRGFLTMLGIIIGVSAVITMLSIGEGSKQSIRDRISGMGSNMIMVMPGGDMRGGGARMSSGNMQTLGENELEAIEKNCPHVALVSPLVQSAGQAINGSNNTPTSIYGVSPDYLEIRQLAIKDGDIFSALDIRTAAKVCVVGKTVVNNLFPDGENPIGAVIRFGSVPMKIVGVLESKGFNAMGSDQDDLILAPYTTIMKRVMATNYFHQIQCSATDENSSALATREIEETLRDLHKVGKGDEDDFNVRSQEEIASVMDTVTGLLTTLLAAIAAISLVVGGIGIMNIMYVSVTERTREIGLRMSIGARGKDILMQFLIEAILLSVTGGIIGILFGIGLTLLGGLLINIPVAIQAWTIALSFLVCTVTGVFFGWYPARKASNLDPIEALRYE